MTIFILPLFMSWAISSKVPIARTSRSAYAAKWPGIQHPLSCYWALGDSLSITPSSLSRAKWTIPRAK